MASVKASEVDGRVSEGQDGWGGCKLNQNTLGTRILELAGRILLVTEQIKGGWEPFRGGSEFIRGWEAVRRGQEALTGGKQSLTGGICRSQDLEKLWKKQSGSSMELLLKGPWWGSGRVSEGSDQYKFGLTLHRSSIEAKWALLFPSDSV